MDVYAFGENVKNACDVMRRNVEKNVRSEIYHRVQRVKINLYKVQGDDRNRRRKNCSK